MESVKQFNGLNGSEISREEIGKIIELAKKENQTDVIFRLFKLLNDNPFDSVFKITDLQIYPEKGLKGIQHTGDYRQALDNCGRLKPGYKFENGRVVKVTQIVKKKPIVLQPNKEAVKDDFDSDKYLKDVLKGLDDKVKNLTKQEVAEAKKLFNNRDQKSKDWSRDWEMFLFDYMLSKEPKRPNYSRKRKYVPKPKVDKKGQIALFGAKKGLNSAIEVEPKPIVAEVIEPVKPKSTVVAKVQNLPQSKYKTAVDREQENKAPKQLYAISGDLSKFLGKIEIKPQQSLAITLDSGEGGGKTHTLYNWANEFYEAGYKTIIWSLEEHASSGLATDKAEQYFGENKAFIPVESENENESKEETVKRIFESVKDFDVIMIDSWAKVMELDKTINFDQDLRKKFNGKLFVVVFQRTSSGEIRGGSKAGFDGDVILKVEVDRDDFRNNYIYNHKNRYNDFMPISDLKYSPYHRALRKTTAEKTADTPKLSFTAIEI